MHSRNIISTKGTLECETSSDSFLHSAPGANNIVKNAIFSGITAMACPSLSEVTVLESTFSADGREECPTH